MAIKKLKRDFHVPWDFTIKEDGQTTSHFGNDKCKDMSIEDIDKFIKQMECFIAEVRDFISMPCRRDPEIVRTGQWCVMSAEEGEWIAETDPSFNFDGTIEELVALESKSESPNIEFRLMEMCYASHLGCNFCKPEDKTLV